MKKIILLASFFSFYLVSCNHQEPAAQETMVEQISYLPFGDTITTEGVIDNDVFLSKINEVDSMPAKLAVTINEACKKKGCWMTVDLGNDKEMLVRFKDYGFFVPMNADGSDAIIEGIARKKVISVDDLKHLAQDAGKSDEEIATITEPEVRLSFEATGVLIAE
jgi:hypothetical protein